MTNVDCFKCELKLIIINKKMKKNKIKYCYIVIKSKKNKI